MSVPRERKIFVVDRGPTRGAAPLTVDQRRPGAREISPAAPTTSGASTRTHRSSGSKAVDETLIPPTGVSR